MMGHRFGGQWSCTGETITKQFGGESASPLQQCEGCMLGRKKMKVMDGWMRGWMADEWRGISEGSARSPRVIGCPCVR